MPYFFYNNLNVLLIHIPKTGGSSVESYFSKKYNIPLNEKSLYNPVPNKSIINDNLTINSSPQHMTYQTIMRNKDLIGIKMNNLKIIAIVRNPYDRIISDLFFYRLINVNSSKEDVFNAIEKYLLRNDLDNHNICQYLFVTNQKKIIPPSIKLLHTESLTEDMIKLGYKDFNQKINLNSNKLNYDNYLNNDSIQLINKYYDEDFKILGYKKR
jgi:hypothetical protein